MSQLIDPEKLEQIKADADLRRVVLDEADCTTYLLRSDHILCLCCGMESRHPKEQEHLYCGFCHSFHRQAGLTDERVVVPTGFSLSEIDWSRSAIASKKASLTPLETLAGLKTDDIVCHVSDPRGLSYMVTDNYTRRATAIRTVDISNPREWALVVSSNYNLGLDR